MFEKSASWRRMAKPRSSSAQRGHAQIGHLGYGSHAAVEEREEGSRGLVIAVIAAFLFHVGLFLVSLPDPDPTPVVEGPPRAAYVVRPVRFRPPPKPSQPQQARPQVREKKRLIPMPDPTPHEPEPEPVETTVQISEDDLLNLVPGVVPGDAPPSPGPPGEQPLPVGGNVSAPKRIYSPSPLYTEEARQGRIQGVVLLQAVIDAEGNVTDVDLIKGLPLGLSESAIETVKTWKFEPAKREGVPVPVFFTLTVSFSLQ